MREKPDEKAVTPVVVKPKCYHTHVRLHDGYGWCCEDCDAIALDLDDCAHGARQSFGCRP